MTTLIVGLIVLAIVVLALRSTIRQSKSGGCSGCSGCGGSCASCHQETPPDKKA
ncbi:MAG TPA: FeoB-associated Cys-rich membrane protein [Candidatus Agathobaculum intestinigallinarum]|nr:FeoB-associated Cys-rich membrane protein [Candidatus Agathobaculum intestinigallinarum]